MSNLLKAEFYKLFHSWYFWGIGLFNLLLSSVLLLDSVGETSNLFFASIYNMPILYFLTIIFSAMFVGNDFGRRTLQSYINAGHRRGKILFAKLVVHQIACMVILSFPLLLHSIIGTFVTKGASVIEAARAGNPLAVERVLRYYEGYMDKLCTRTLYDLDGSPRVRVDEYMKRRLQSRLIRAILNSP